MQGAVMRTLRKIETVRKAQGIMRTGLVVKSETGAASLLGKTSRAVAVGTRPLRTNITVMISIIIITIITDITTIIIIVTAAVTNTDTMVAGTRAKTTSHRLTSPKLIIATTSKSPGFFFFIKAETALWRELVKHNYHLIVS